MSVVITTRSLPDFDRLATTKRRDVAPAGSLSAALQAIALCVRLKRDVALVISSVSSSVGRPEGDRAAADQRRGLDLRYRRRGGVIDDSDGLGRRLVVTDAEGEFVHAGLEVDHHRPVAGRVGCRVVVGREGNVVGDARVGGSCPADGDDRLRDRRAISRRQDRECAGSRRRMRRGARPTARRVLSTASSWCDGDGSEEERGGEQATDGSYRGTLLCGAWALSRRGCPNWSGLGISRLT